MRILGERGLNAQLRCAGWLRLPTRWRSHRHTELVRQGTCTLPSSLILIALYLIATGLVLLYVQASSARPPDSSWTAQVSPDDVRVLLHGGADLAERDADGLTPLHHAVGNPNVRVLETLLEYGADPNLTDFEGRQVLESAVGRADRREHASALVRFGANFDALDATMRVSLGLTLPSSTCPRGQRDSKVMERAVRDVRHHSYISARSAQ